MAEVAVSFVVEKLGSMLIHKLAFLQGVERQVKWLKEELERMQCFLKDAVEKQANDESIRKWISDMRDVAQDAEDVIETFILKVDAPRRRRGLLETCACFPDHVYHLDKVGEEIESIRARLKDIRKSCERYKFQSLGEQMTTKTMSPEAVKWRRQLSHWQKDKHVVGLDDDVDSVLHNIVLKKRKGLIIGNIVGMGGVGKSTLARILYNHDAVADRFDCRAWVCVSSEFNPRETIKELVLQLLEPTDDKLTLLDIMEKSPLEPLRSMVYERLRGRRYFVVLDDVWEASHWQFLASAFPNEQDKTSTLLLTTRNQSVTKDAEVYVHQLKFLDPRKSWELFLKKAFIGNTDGKCPEELKETAIKILKKCNGLPLAITVIGGLLAKQGQSKDEWTKVLNGMNSHLKTGENNVTAILELSYHNLPPQLKSCFLCLGFFKEDATIRAEKLIQVWIAQGLVPPKGEQEETMEEMARDYLDELINRNMIQVKDMTKDNRVKNCQIHDLLHNLSITKAKEEISLEIIRQEGSSQSSKKPRHRSIYCATEKPVFSAYKNNHIRSLFFHGSGNNIYGSSTYWRSFQLLRVLDFENFGLESLPEAIGELTGLRYLGLRNNDIKELPSSFGRLKNLQVLDISLNFSVEVPSILWKMISLRHLYMSRITCKSPPKVDYLKNLQTLIYIPMPRWMPEHTKRMTSLRKLGLELDENSDVINLCASLAMLANLVCLNLRWYGHHGIAFEDGLGKLRRLTQLKLQGRMTELPSVDNFPPNLSHLSMNYTVLDKDPMPVLEKLPKLVHLKLDYAFTGEEMAISRGGLPKLKVFSLSELFKLSNIRVEEGGMPELRRLEIHRCPHLENLPEELQFLTDLRELKMVTTPEITLKLRGEDSHILYNIPSVHLVSVPFQN